MGKLIFYLILSFICFTGAICLVSGEESLAWIPDPILSFCKIVTMILLAPYIAIVVISALFFDR